MNQVKRTMARNLVFTVMALLLALVIKPAFAGDAEKAQGLVDTSRVAFRDMMEKDKNKALSDHLEEAKAVLIVPNLFKAGFVLGGTGGSGVLLVRDQENGRWGHPAFYTLSSVTLGAQIGAESAQAVTVIKSQQALDNLLATSTGINGAASATAGPYGSGAKVNLTTSMITFSDSKGIYAGISLEGAVLRTNDEYNKAYYNRAGIRPSDIVVKANVRNPGADSLRNTLDSAPRWRARLNVQ